MNPSSSITALGALSLAFASSLSAQTLVRYNFVDPDTTGPLTYRAPSITGANLTASTFANGAGLNLTNSSSVGSTAEDTRSIWAHGATGSGSNKGVNEPISASSTDWVGFTIEADEGYVLNLTNLSFDYAYNSPGTGPATFDLRSSLDYNTSIEEFVTAPVSGTTPTWVNASVGLSAAAYQGLSSITFRIYLSDGEYENAASYLRLDTIILSGVSQVPSQIPEPSSAAALVGLCGLGFAAARRRRAA